MSQTISRSLLESVTNIIIGFLIVFIFNIFFLPWLGFKTLTVEKNLLLGTLYTAISLVRSFSIRRLFNRL